MNKDAPNNDELLKLFNEVEKFLDEQAQLEHRGGDVAPLSDDAKKVLEDTKQLFESMKKLLKNKNSEEQLQQIVNKCQEISKKAASAAEKKGVKVSGEAGRKMASENAPVVKDIAQNVLFLGRKLMVSSEFRDILSEIVEVLQECFHNATDKAAEATKEKLSGTSDQSKSSDKSKSHEGHDYMQIDSPTMKANLERSSTSSMPKDQFGHSPMQTPEHAAFF
jgi:hypothetical protein